MRKKELYIPVNIPERNDFFAGYGVKELIATAIALIVGAGLAVVIYLLAGSLFFAFGSMGVLVGMTILLVRRDQIDESFIDKLNFVHSYQKQQKRYEYVYYDFYSDVRDYEEKKKGGKRK